MGIQNLLSAYMTSLLDGERQACKRIVTRALEDGASAMDVYERILWPAMERSDAMFREDRIGIATEHMATRINRWLASQLQAHLPIADPIGKRIVITCADNEPEDVGAAMAADLFEAAGWDTYFVGGGVPDDEILSLVGKYRPNVLLIFGTTPSGVPGVRRLIDLIREVGVHPIMNIMVSGGVFQRADGLWQEVNADIYAETMRDALEMAGAAEPRKAEIRIAGVPKKRRRRRRPPLLAAAEA